MDVQKIDVTSIIDLQLGRRMAFNRQRQFVRPYPAAVINHQDSHKASMAPASATVRLPGGRASQQTLRQRGAQLSHDKRELALDAGTRARFFREE